MELRRQGDVLFRKVAALPKGKRNKRENGTVAYGEVTGHSHRLADHSTADVLEIGPRLFVRVLERDVTSATFIHEEHGPITLPSGNYEVIIQREYAPEGIRSVLD